jgi:hypothetical protein
MENAQERVIDYGLKCTIIRESYDPSWKPARSEAEID